MQFRKEEAMDEVIQQKDEAGGMKAEGNERVEITERRIRLVEDPQSMVVAPKTREGHVLVRLVFGLDRAVSRIRHRAGTYINVQDAVARLKKVEEFISEFNEFVNSFGDGRMFWGFFYETLEMKRMLARMRNTHILLPRTNEAKEIVLLVKRLDPALLQFRNTCTDFAKSEEFFRKLIDTIKKFDLLVQELSSLVNIPYDRPRDIGPLLKLVSSAMDSSEQEPQSQEIRQEEVPPRKGRKSGGVV